jgi:hypothetical protein
VYAALVTVSIDPAQNDAARTMLNDMIVPTVSAAPGFVSGTWLEPVNGKSTAIVVFDTEANARATAPPPGPAPAGGVVVENVEFIEVAAHA